MIKTILLLITVSLSTPSFSQIPIKKIEEKIMELKGDEEISVYWDALESEDQYTLLPIENVLEYDSMSINNMIETCFMFKHHGIKGVNLYNFTVPILNLSHNRIPEASLVFWPIIELCKEYGGAIQTFGGKYPAYELEVVSLGFYGYSLLYQDSIYESLLNKLSGQKIDLIVAKLDSIQKENKKLYQLKQLNSIGLWNRQPFLNSKEEGCFEFVKMDNNELYLKNYDRLQKLVFKNRCKRTKYYRIEKEPFGWYYSLSKSGELKLLNENDEVLIEYSKCQ